MSRDKQQEMILSYRWDIFLSSKKVEIFVYGKSLKHFKKWNHMLVMHFINSFDRYLLGSKLMVVASGGSVGMDKTRGN